MFCKDVHSHARVLSSTALSHTYTGIAALAADLTMVALKKKDYIRCVIMLFDIDQAWIISLLGWKIESV